MQDPNERPPCPGCGKVWYNPYGRGGDREGMEDLDSLGQTPKFAYRDQVLCDECFGEELRKEES